MVLSADQDSFNSFERPRLHTHPIAACEERIGLDLRASIDHLAYGIDLGFGDDGGLGPVSQYADKSRCGHELRTVLRDSSQKQVAREQGERKLLGPVPPTALRGVKREENFETFVRKHLRDDFFVLMASVGSAPAGIKVGDIFAR
jgi:hypothetical protein